MRAHRVDDFAACAALWADPGVVRYISGTPSTGEQSWSRLLRYAGHWTLLHYGYWLVEERDGGAFVGEVGFADYHRVIEPRLDGVPELGWVLAKPMHGKGYATEAVSAAIAWAEERLAPYRRIVCIIAPENAASIRVAEKCGFTLIAETTYQTLPTLMYGRALSGGRGPEDAARRPAPRETPGPPDRR
jgi:RimJ/RimL family protein N-acetyltransferase